MSLTYTTFLHSATALLTSNGAHPLLQSLAGAEPPWSFGWDQILVSTGPGQATVFAFTGVEDPTTFQERLDRLARGVASLTTAARGTLALAAIAVLPPGLSLQSRHAIQRASPSTFYQGLRPLTWTVDMATGDVSTGRFRNREEAELLRTALRNAAEGEVLDPGGISQQQQSSIRRQQAFYQLMQGRLPYTTYGLIAINVLLYLLVCLKGGTSFATGPTDAALRDMGATSPILIEHGQWWRLFTAVFLHANITHILFNMTSLFAVGTLAERLYGSARFLAIYLGAGLIGSLTSFLYAVVSGNTDVLGVGASGAIFGVAGALLTIRFQQSEVIPRQLRNRVSTSIAPLVGISLVVAFLTPHVDNSAHLGGLLGGMALSFVFPLVREVPLKP